MDNILEMHLNGHSGEEIIAPLLSDFPYVCSKAYLNRYHVFWHWHKAVELFFVDSGTLEYDTPQGRAVFPAGSGGLVNMDILHTSRPQKDSHHTIQLLHIFDAAFLSGQTEGRIFQKYFAPILSSPQVELIPLYPNNPHHKDTLEKLKASFDVPTSEFDYELRLREALTGIWVDLLRLLPPDLGTGSRSSRKIKQMMAYVHEHYRENIAVADIAAAGYASERDCYRAFRDFLHTTPGEYIRSCRLQAACKMLVDGDESITQISHACGFGSGSFFGKVFRSRFGVSPLAYRRKWQDTTK